MKTFKRLFCIVLSSLLLFSFSAGETAHALTAGQGYVIINNESTDADGYAYTGSFTIKNKNYTMNKKLQPSAYKMDLVKPFNIAKHKDSKIRRKTMYTPFAVGDSKAFWVTDIESDSDYSITAKLLYSGTKSNVWVYNNQISSLDAQKLGQEFDNKIKPIVNTNFGVESDVDGNGKVNILCYDIQDGFSGSGGYVAGYFNPYDLFDLPDSNQMEVFNIDTYPSMGTGSVKDVTQAYSTLAHEFQHMVNFNRTAFIENSTSQMDTWLDEGLSMAAEQIYTGQALTDRIAYYNYSDSITDGHSLLYWDDEGDVLANYSLSYLFAEYLKLQANQGDKIFKEILEDPNNNYRAVEDVIHKYIDPTMTFGKFMTSFREALLLKQATGLYGFKGDTAFSALNPKIYNGYGTDLHGGGAIVKIADLPFTAPEDKDSDITYTLLGDDTDMTAPVLSTVNQVSDQDTTVTGITEAGATVYVKKGSTQLGYAAADDSGNFSVPISKQTGGTILSVYAVDAAGNPSSTTSITVKDTIPPAAPSVNPVSDNQTTVTGKAEVGTTVYVKSGSTVLGTATATSTGFSVKIIAQKAGTKLTIYAQDGGGNKSTDVTIIVLDKTAPIKPAVSTTIKDNQTVIIGKTEAGAKVVIKAGSTVLGQGYAVGSGTFVVKMVRAQKAGTVVTIYASDTAGNQSQTLVTVVDKTPPAAPSVNKVTYKSTTVTGKAEVGATVYIYKGTSLVGKAVSDRYGNYKAAIRAQAKGSTLDVSAMDKAGNQSRSVFVKVY
ncbi:Ig-like domain-containing protein [Neobacillus cucumis]|uniref:Ig-like domain-containing protein n=1 Tax=Neobacillus cucumis TaxID=1740721 RepID=UPI00203C3E86|nr:Ig-like domain-containing protein [Neobacillus cucumis]MCM3729088.1 Ig-like domain-containing protein [Neobacillus cucumis]